VTVADCEAMRIIIAGFLLSLLSLSAAEYFSSGWKPGQTASSTTINPAATFDPSKPTPGHESKPTAGALVSLLTGGPIGALLNRAGINVTQKLEEARIKEDNKWDKRIPLLTDANYKDIVVQEKLTPDEEFKRIWFIIITVTAGQNGGISEMFDKKFDEAYDLTVKAKDLKHVKWGRVDYMNVTTITTKWGVWRAPTLVVVSDRGRSLRFLNARYLRPQPELMRTWLLEERYLEIPTWQSQFGPGGKREFLMDYLAIVFDKWYKLTTSVPRWILYIATGGLASLLIQVMHRGSKKTTTKTTVETAGTESILSDAAPSTATTSSHATASATQRKTRNKK